LLTRLRDIDERRAVDITRLLTMSIADLVEDFFVSDAVKAAASVSGVIGTWAGPRHRLCHGAPPHRRPR
jgi:hypothetical protein